MCIGCHYIFKMSHLVRLLYRMLNIIMYNDFLVISMKGQVECH